MLPSDVCPLLGASSGCRWGGAEGQLCGNEIRTADDSSGSAVIRRAVGELSFDLTGTMFEAGRLVRASYSHRGHRQCQLYPDTGRWRRGRVRARATAMCPRP